MGKFTFWCDDYKRQEFIPDWEVSGGCDTCVKWMGVSPYREDGTEAYPGAVEVYRQIQARGKWTGDCPGPKGDE